MATYQPVRMPSSEWASKDKPNYDRNHNTNPFRHGTPPPKQTASVPSAEQSVFSPEPPVTSSQMSSTQGQDVKAGNGIKTAIESASETVKPYLPGSVAAYLPAGAAAKHSQLPSKEVPGGSNVGVGSLPGNLSEASVAKLPEERAMEARQNTAAKDIPHKQDNKSAAKQSNVSTSPSMLQSAKGYLPESVAAYLPGGAPADSPLPSKEKPSGSAGGVGSLPGNYSEVSVAKLPEERRLEGMPSHESDHEILGKSKGAGPLPGGPNESRVAMLPEERIHPQYDSGVTGSKGMAAAAGLGAVGAGAATGMAHRGGGTPQLGSGAAGTTGATHSDVRNDPGYHPAQLHPLDPKFKHADAGGAHTSSLPSAEKSATSGGSSERRSTSGSEGSNGERQKVGFMQKMKGEVKVISGKLGHNEKKVEEGRHMMGKQ